MSNNISPESQGPKFLCQSPKVALLCTIITLVLAALTFCLGYYWGKQEIKNLNNAQNNNSAADLSIPLPPLPPEIYSYTGEITAIDGLIIQLKINVLTDQAEETEKILKVFTDDKTSFIKRNKDYIPLPGEEIPTETISLANLKVSDNVTVSAEENIKDKAEFTATQIQLNY